MWPVVNQKTVVFDGSFELKRFEKIVRTGAGKDRDALGCRLNLRFEVSVNPNQILVDTGPLRGVRFKGFRALRKFLAHKDIVVVFPMLVGLAIKIQAHDR
jgi:hypothetical protein